MGAVEEPEEAELEAPEDRPDDPAAFFAAQLAAAAKADPHARMVEVEDSPRGFTDEGLVNDDEFARMEAAFSNEADSSGWEDPDADEGSAPAPRAAARPRPQAPRRKPPKTDDGQSRLSLDEALERVSPEARDVLVNNLKGQFREVRRFP